MSEAFSKRTESKMKVKKLLRRLAKTGMKIGAHHYNIKYPYRYKSESLQSQHRGCSKDITLTDVNQYSEKYKDSQLLVNFIHELLHAVFETYCMEYTDQFLERKTEELLCRGISEGFAQIILDNFRGENK